MIITNMITSLLGVIASVISSVTIASMSADLMQGFYDSIDYFFGNLSLLGLFVNPTHLAAAASICLAMITFKHVYMVFTWAKNKINPLK